MVREEVPFYGERKYILSLVITVSHSMTQFNRSARNNRIERLWVEVGTQFARSWRAFFRRLEKIHLLNIQCAEHLWLLHVLFLPQINSDCETFRNHWNVHPISGSETRLKSPHVGDKLIFFAS
jgi:hypothetical protein